MTLLKIYASVIRLADSQFTRTLEGEFQWNSLFLFMLHIVDYAVQLKI